MINFPSQITAPELKILLLASRCAFTAEESVALNELLTGDLNGHFLLEEAGRQGVLPLLHASLRAEGLFDDLPAQVRLTLTEAAQLRARRNLSKTAELVRILRALAADDITPLPFKGPVVALAAYGNVAMRDFSDLDILVDYDSFARARNVLSRLGYSPKSNFKASDERDFLRTECALQLHHANPDFVVELHWRFSERNASVELPVRELLERSRSIPFFGVTIASLSTEDLVLYLCMHGSKHQWDRLEWISCVAELLRRNPGIDWELLFTRARYYNILRVVHLGLSLTAHLLNFPLPAAVAAQVNADVEVRPLVNWVVAGLFSESCGPHYQRRAVRCVFQLRSRERWLDRFRILLYSVIRSPHPEAHEWLDLPPRLAFLHHVFRPVRLLREFGALAWRHYLRPSKP